MKTTIETLTDAQINALRTEAGEAGDFLQLEICNVALSGRVSEDSYETITYAERNRLCRMTESEAREICLEVINK